MMKEKVKSGKKFLPAKSSWEEPTFISWYARGYSDSIDSQFSICDGIRVVRFGQWVSNEKDAKDLAGSINTIIEQLNAYKAALGELYTIQPDEADIDRLPWEE